MNDDVKKIVMVLGAIAAVMLIAGLIRVCFPLIMIGLVVYVVYCFIRGPKS